MMVENRCWRLGCKVHLWRHLLRLPCLWPFFRGHGTRIAHGDEVDKVTQDPVAQMPAIFIQAEEELADRWRASYEAVQDAEENALSRKYAATLRRAVLRSRVSALHRASTGKASADRRGVITNN